MRKYLHANVVHHFLTQPTRKIAMSIQAERLHQQRQDINNAGYRESLHIALCDVLVNRCFYYDRLD